MAVSLYDIKFNGKLNSGSAIMSWSWSSDAKFSYSYTKRSEIWDSGVVVICTFGLFGTLVCTACNLKRTSVEQNRIKFGWERGGGGL